MLDPTLTTRFITYTASLILRHSINILPTGERIQFWKLRMVARD